MTEGYNHHIDNTPVPHNDLHFNGGKHSDNDGSSNNGNAPLKRYRLGIGLLSALCILLVVVSAIFIGLYTRHSGQHTEHLRAGAKVYPWTADMECVEAPNEETSFYFADVAFNFQKEDIETFYQNLKFPMEVKVEGSYYLYTGQKVLVVRDAKGTLWQICP